MQKHQTNELLLSNNPYLINGGFKGLRLYQWLLTKHPCLCLIWKNKHNLVAARRNTMWTSGTSNELHLMRRIPAGWQCRAVMSENDQRFLDGEARVHIKMLLWKAAKLSGGRRGARNQQQAHQSLLLAGRQAGWKEEPTPFYWWEQQFTVQSEHTLVRNKLWGSKRFVSIDG